MLNINECIFPFCFCQGHGLRGDYLCLLVLCCNCFTELPELFKKFLVYKQETISSARWLTSASGYLRIYQNHLYDESDKEKLVWIVSFIVDVYTPFWFSIHLNPRCPDGPKNILFARDLLLAHHDQDLVSFLMPYFLTHAATWMSPKNVACLFIPLQPPFLYKM